MVSVFSRRSVATRFARLRSRLLAKLSGKILAAGGVLLLGVSLASAQAGPVTQSQAGPSQRVQLEGQLEIIHDDFKDGRGRYLYFLKLSDGARVPLHFVKEPPTHFLTGDHVRASGQLSGGALTLYSGSANMTKTTGSTTSTSSTPVPYTFGAQYTLVMLVNFQDDAVQPYTVAYAQSVFFGTASNFILENSYGQTWLTGDVVGWFTIPVSVTTCDGSQIATAAQNAATAAGVNLSSYSRYVYAFPLDSACGFAGASDIGGNPSQSWINGMTGLGGTVLDIHVIDHELGHALGLYHSHSLDCGTTETLCSNGTIVEYGDFIDTMGEPQTASPDYNAFQKERLGWLGYGASPSIETVQTSGTYTINPYELGGPGPNALKVLKSYDRKTGVKVWYYLEARQAIGSDAFLTTWPYYSTQNETTGVLFHIGTEGDPNSSEMLDMTPATPTTQGFYDMSLAIGQSFQDPTAGVTFTTMAVGGAGATVQITFGPVCAPAAPSVSLSPSQSQYVTSGTAVNFTAAVTDNDSSACAPANFDLADALPSGWAGVWSAAALALSPGKSGSATLTVTSPAGTADGSYSVAVSATNASASSYTGSAAATYVVAPPLTASVTTNQSTYLPGQTVAISVTLLYGASPDVGASVSVTVTAPDGKTTSLSGTTDSNGVALLSYKLSRNAAAGIYRVQAGTTVTGASATAGASTSFTVQ